MPRVTPPSPSALARLRASIAASEAGSASEDAQDQRASRSNPEAEGPVDPEAEAGRAAEGKAHTAIARGVREAAGPLGEVLLPRRAADAHDVVIDVTHCGLCHSDVHAARGEWGGRAMPLVTGHEIVGTVAAVGDAVTQHRVGDRVGVGCMVGSCRECPACQAGEEMFCEQGSVGTYGAWDRFHGERTQGGYSTSVVVPEDFVLRIPEQISSAGAAPLLCAGITTYSPLRAAGVGPGSQVAVAGLGGLGHMAVKLAAAMGAQVTVITRSRAKEDSARELGAQHVLVSSEPESLEAAKGSFDVVIDAIAARHDLNEFLRLLRPHGRLVLVGLPPTSDGGAGAEVDTSLLVRNGLFLGGSKIGGIPETQQMLDFCAEHGVEADVEVVGAEELDDAWDRMVAGDVRYRFVLDTATLA